MTTKTTTLPDRVSLIVICEHCGQKNDRAEYANWCTACANAAEKARKRDQERRNEEFETHMNRRAGNDDKRQN